MDLTCFVCGQPIPATRSIHRARLCINVCHGNCDRLVTALAKDFSKSKNGRQRTRRQWLRAIEEAKEKMPKPPWPALAPDPEMARVHIRWMLRRDMPEVLQIDGGLDEPWGEDEFLRVLRKRNCIAMVAEHGESVVAFHVYELHKFYLDVLNFAVDPQWRRLSVGKQMIDKLKSKLSSHRRTAIKITVSDANLAMLLFLKRQGFTSLPMGRGDDTITMEHRIGDHTDMPANRIAQCPFQIGSRPGSTHIEDDQ